VGEFFLENNNAVPAVAAAGANGMGGMGEITILTATDLVVRYNEEVVLDGATLGIEEGDRIGLVGRNGSGKTTLLRILAGLQLPTSGVVSKRRDLVISYLSQDFTLDAALNVYENIRSGAQHVLDL